MEHRNADNKRLKSELHDISENNRRLYEDKLKLEGET